MSDESHWKRKCLVICLLALFIGLIGIVLPEQEDIAFEVLLNNTELCQYNHTLNRCTGERNTSTKYWANDSAIQIFLMSHANSVGANASIQLFINGTQIEHVSGRPLAAAEDNYKSITAIIPKGANYSATFLNFHHYEWREYPILSGKNGTLSINQTVVGGTGSQNLSQVLTQGNDANNYGILNLNNISGAGANKQTTIINTSFNMNRTINWTDSNLISDGMMVTRNNGNITSVFRDMGAQFWYLHYSSASAGYVAGDFGGVIGYSTPSNGIGFSLRNSTPGINQTLWTSQWRHDLYFRVDAPGSNDYFLCVAPGNQTTVPTCKLKIYANGNITHPALVGAGNAYLCVDSTGTEFRGNPGC